jgi:GH25 family lysozyme M1 (1,4-beta-N-acetylmuramidase)
MTTPYLPQTMSDIVIDLSHWEAPADFAQVKASGIAAVILKATQGTGFVDPTFAARTVAANTAGLLVGTYHFSTIPIPQRRRVISSPPLRGLASRC